MYAYSQNDSIPSASLAALTVPDPRPPRRDARRSTASPNMLYNPSAAHGATGWTHLSKARWKPHLSATPPPGSRANFVSAAPPARWACMAQPIALSHFAKTPGALRVEVSARFRAAPPPPSSHRGPPRFQFAAVLYDGTCTELAVHALPETPAPSDRWLRVRHVFDAAPAARFVLLVVAGEGGARDPRVSRGTRVACCSARLLCDLASGDADAKLLVPGAFTRLSERDIGPARVVQAYVQRQRHIDIPESVRNKLTNGLSKDGLMGVWVSKDGVGVSGDGMAQEEAMVEHDLDLGSPDDVPDVPSQDDIPDFGSPDDVPDVDPSMSGLTNFEPLKMITATDEVVNFGHWTVPPAEECPPHPEGQIVSFDDMAAFDSIIGQENQDAEVVEEETVVKGHVSPISEDIEIEKPEPKSEPRTPRRRKKAVAAAAAAIARLRALKPSRSHSRRDLGRIGSIHTDPVRKNSEIASAPQIDFGRAKSAHAAIGRVEPEEGSYPRTRSGRVAFEHSDEEPEPLTDEEPAPQPEEVEEAEVRTLPSSTAPFRVKEELPPRSTEEISFPVTLRPADTSEEPISESLVRSTGADSARNDGLPERKSETSTERSEDQHGRTSDASSAPPDRKSATSFHEFDLPPNLRDDGSEEVVLRRWLYRLQKTMGSISDMRIVSPNMIINPSGKDGCSGWKHLASDRWSTEVSVVPCGDSRVNFVANRAGCAMAQPVDLARFLRKPGKVGIQVSARYRSRPDAPALFCLRAALYDAHGQELAFGDTGGLVAPCDGWELASLEFAPTPGAHYALMFVSGADSNGVRFGTKVVDCNIRAILDVSAGNTEGMLPPRKRPALSEDSSGTVRRVMSAYRRRMSTEVYSRAESSTFDSEDEDDIDDNSWTSSICDPSRFFSGRFAGMRVLSPNLLFNANAEEGLSGWTNILDGDWETEKAGIPFGASKTRCANFVSVSGRCAIAQPVDLRNFVCNPATVALTVTAHFRARNDAGAEGMVRLQAVVFDNKVRCLEAFDSGEMDATRGRWASVQLDIPPVGHARYVLVVVSARGGGGARVAECSVRALCDPLYGNADRLLDGERITNICEKDVGPAETIKAFQNYKHEAEDTNEDDASNDDVCITRIESEQLPSFKEASEPTSSRDREKSSLGEIGNHSGQDRSLSVSDVSCTDEWHGPFSRRRCSSGNMLFNSCGAHGMRGWTHLNGDKEEHWGPGSSGNMTNFTSTMEGRSAMGQAVDVEKFVRGAGGVSYSISARFRRCPGGKSRGSTFRLVAGLLDAAGEEVRLYDSGRVAQRVIDGSEEKWMNVKHVFAPMSRARFIVVTVEGANGMEMRECSVSAMYYGRHDGAQTVVEERFSSLCESDVVPRGVVVRFARRHVADIGTGVTEWNEDQAREENSAAGNLLANASGTDGVRGWVHVSEGTWIADGKGFTSSRRWCAMCQTVDLSRTGRGAGSRFVELRAVVRGEGDGEEDGVFRLEGGVLDERFRELKRVVGSEVELQADEGWQTARLVCEPVAGARYVVIVVSGRSSGAPGSSGVIGVGGVVGGGGGGGKGGVRIGEVSVRAFDTDPDDGDEARVVTEVGGAADAAVAREVTGRAVRHFFGGGRRGVWRWARWVE